MHNLSKDFQQNWYNHQTSDPRLLETVHVCLWYPSANGQERSRGLYCGSWDAPCVPAGKASAPHILAEDCAKFVIPW